MSDALKSQSEIRGMLPALIQEVRSAKGVLIGTHLNPDGDAIGSALAMSFILDQLDVEHDVLCSDPPPYYLKFLPGVDRIRQKPEGDEHSLALILDLEARNRLGSVSGYFEACPRAVVIDHHIPHEAPGDLRIVCTQSPATCSILHDLITDSEIAMIFPSLSSPDWCIYRKCLVSLSRPQVNISIRSCLHLTASVEQPLFLDIWAVHAIPDQEVKIPPAKVSEVRLCIFRVAKRYLIQKALIVLKSYTICKFERVNFFFRPGRKLSLWRGKPHSVRCRFAHAKSLPHVFSIEIYSHFHKGSSFTQFASPLLG